MKAKQRQIEVWADWVELQGSARMGVLRAALVRGKEVFSFEYDPAWLKSGMGRVLDPALGFYEGPQFAPVAQGNFGVFLDSSPDRWGRMLMQRREAQSARAENRPQQTLVESDYLLGVYDANRMGALRFKEDPDGPFLDDDAALATPPWTRLRELEAASLVLDRDDAESDPRYSEWLSLLIAPGSSLGGARPKASVVDEQGHPWIAKFPSHRDTTNVGGWEWVAHQLANKAGVVTATAQAKQFASKRHTFLVERFDRVGGAQRVHFASAMTLLQRADGQGADAGVSYLELAGLIVQQSGRPNEDLEQLWRRIVFSMSICNVDDHLRNHGFLLSPRGWNLSPAYDLNPVADGTALTLNVSETENALDFDLALEVASYFRIKPSRAAQIVGEVKGVVRGWREVAQQIGISTSEQDRMARAFRLTEAE